MQQFPPRAPLPPPQACHKAALDVSSEEAYEALPRGAVFLLPHISELVLAKVSNLQRQLPGLLPTLKRSAPTLRALVVSAPLGRQAYPAHWLAQLPLQLQRLELVDVLLPHGRLEGVTHLHQLTEVALSLTGPGLNPAAATAGVACLTCLRGLQVRQQRACCDGAAGCANWAEPETCEHRNSVPCSGHACRHCTFAAPAEHPPALPSLCLQALELPLLGEEEREALSRLTGLTRLAFTAGGRGAVGPSLRPLARLQHLTLRLWHVHEHFLVLHPRLDWAALAALASLRRLEVCHLAANTFFAAPEVTWLDEAPAAHQADVLVGTLPDIEQLVMR